MEECRLAAKDLACRRGERLLFARLSLELAGGQALQVAGPNGMGKSSLIRLLAGLLRPTAGETSIDEWVTGSSRRSAMPLKAREMRPSSGVEKAGRRVSKRPRPVRSSACMTWPSSPRGYGPPSGSASPASMREMACIRRAA